MKTMFKLPQLCGAVLLLSCTTAELPPQAEPVKVVVSSEIPPAIPPVITPAPILDGVARMYQAFALTGETSATPKADLVMPAPSQKAEMSALKTAGSNSELNYIALGGSLTAGFRDYGLTRESQLTAYPNLIAHQMGLVNFKSPLFDVTEANGSGGLVFDGTGDMPSWKQVTNKTALKSNTPMALSKYTGANFQNVSIPFLGFDAIKGNFDTYFYSPATAFIERLAKPSDMIPSKVANVSVMPSLASFVEKQNAPDIFTLEFGFDSNIENLLTQKANWSAISGSIGSYSHSADFKGKPVWVVMPMQVLRFPYFNFFTYEKLIKKLGVSEIMIGRYSDQSIEKANKNCIFLPTQRIIDAIKNKTAIDVIPDIEVLDELEVGSANSSQYVDLITYNAKQKNIPTVDLTAVYDKVLNGQYVSEDGFKIDPSFPKGNFFSQDGIYPSAIGQAVIANEVIKVMNKAYKTNIPLINLTKYARSLSK